VIVAFVDHPHPVGAHRSTIARCQALSSRSNHSRTDSAITAPTPSTADSSSALAARMAAIDPKCRASARAVVGPHAGSTGRPAPARAAVAWPPRGWRRASAVGRQHPAVDDRLGRIGLLRRPGVERDRAISLLRPTRRASNRSALVGEDARVEQGDRPLPAERLDVEGAPAGQPEQPLAQLGRAERALGQRMSLSPSFSGASGCRRTGSASA
jgi:hypothetical protein